MLLSGVAKFRFATAPMALQTAFWIQRPTELMQLLARRYGSAFTLALAPFRIALFSDPDSMAWCGER